MIPWQTSRPMKSASSSGAHRVVEADPCPRVDVLGRADALAQGPHSLGEERHQHSVDEEARPVGRHDDLLAEIGRERAHVSTVASEVADPRTSSTSGMIGTGLKKCIPTKRDRRTCPTASARRSIEIELVFEAKTASGGAIRIDLRQKACLTARSSKIASTTSPAAAARAGLSVATIRASVASRSYASRRPLSTDRERLAAIRCAPLRPWRDRARTG